MKKAVLLAIGSITLLAGCSNQSNTAANIPATPKWKGEPYRIEFDKQAPKAAPGVIALPVVKFTANPDALETRAILIVRFDADDSKAAKNGPVVNQELMAPVDVRGTAGALPADYMDRASKGISTLLEAYCMNGKVKLAVALARSSLTNTASDSELDEKRLSDWLPIELTYKNPHPGCGAKGA